MKLRLLFFALYLFFIQISFSNPNELSQRPPTDSNIFGHVLNKETGEHVSFITLNIKGTRIATITDYTGHYFIANIPKGKHTLVVQGMGYETTYVTFEIDIKQTLEIDVDVAPKAIDLSEIVITASPTQSGFRYQPDQAYFGETLQRKSEASFGEMLNAEPGVAMRSMGSMNARPVIRGMDGERILILENGERMGDVSETAPDHSISIDPLAASRVEVVRGPASLLYGSSALGGVINIMTTDIPDQENQGSSGILAAQAASVNNMGAAFGRYTYASDKWAASSRFAYRQAGNTNTPEGELLGTSMENYDGSVGVGFNNSKSQGGISFSMTGQAFELPDSEDYDNERIEIRMQRMAIQGRLQNKHNGFFEKSLFRINATQMNQEEIELERETTGNWNEEVDFEYDKTTVSSTFIANHKPIGIFDRGAIGLSFYNHKMDVIGEEAFIPGENRLNTAIFTYQEIPISGMVRLQSGIRVEYQHVTALQNANFPDINAYHDVINFAGSAGINIRPSNNWEIGGQFARAHRAPSINELFADGAHLGAGIYEVGSTDLNSEIGHGGDLFIRYQNSKITAEIAGFINYYRNYIIFQSLGVIDPVSGFEMFQYSQDEARMRGGELSLKYNPIEKFAITLGADYVYGNRNGNVKDYLPFIPPLRIMADVEYDFGNTWIGANILNAFKQNNVAPNESTTDGYTLIGMQAGYRLNFAGKQVIILRVDNLLDVAYRDHLSRVQNRNNPMPGRNITLAYRWYF
jgi:iron complex outermembrane recepter protein